MDNVNLLHGYSASVLFSEERQHGIKEEKGLRGIRGGGTYDGRASTDLSQSLQLAKNVTVDKIVSLYVLQVNVCTDMKDDYYNQHLLSFYLTECLLLDNESIHGVATCVSY